MEERSNENSPGTQNSAHLPKDLNRETESPQALAENRMILLASQKNQEEEEPGPDSVFGVGTVAVIMRMLKLPDGRIRVLVQGIGRARIEGFEDGRPYLHARI